MPPVSRAPTTSGLPAFAAVIRTVSPDVGSAAFASAPAASSIRVATLSPARAAMYSAVTP